MQTRLTAFVAVIVVIALAIGTTMGYTISSQKTFTITIVTTQTSVISAIQFESTTITKLAVAENECGFTTICSVLGPMGLELLFSVNSTRLNPNNSIILNITVINTLSAVDNVSFSNAWAIAGLEQPCDFERATGFAVFSGYFALNNLSSAAPLNLWPHVPACPSLIQNGTLESFVGILRNVTSYSFLPRSDMANCSAYYFLEPSNNSITAPLFGEFSMSMSNFGIIFTNNSSEPTLNSVATAVYTLAVGDEWGDLVLLHFSVT